MMNNKQFFNEFRHDFNDVAVQVPQAYYENPEQHYPT